LIKGAGAEETICLRANDPCVEIDETLEKLVVEIRRWLTFGRGIRWVLEMLVGDCER
jgi:anti-sigma factor ChrR (cupin superfamily)